MVGGWWLVVDKAKKFEPAKIIWESGDWILVTLEVYVSRSHQVRFLTALYDIVPSPRLLTCPVGGLARSVSWSNE